MLEASHDDHKIELTEEQGRDEQLEILLHGFHGGQPTSEELEGMGISAEAKDWKAEMKAKLFNYEHEDIENLDDIVDPMEGVKEEL